MSLAPGWQHFGVTKASYSLRWAQGDVVVQTICRRASAVWPAGRTEALELPERGLERADDVQGPMAHGMGRLAVMLIAAG